MPRRSTRPKPDRFRSKAEQVERQVRAFAPAPGAWFELEGERYQGAGRRCCRPMSAALTGMNVLDEG
jgi:methionyl-tRNA formyltransferase